MPPRGAKWPDQGADPVYQQIKNRSRQIDEAVDMPEPSVVATPKKEEYVSDMRTTRGDKVWNDEAQRWEKRGK